VDGRFRHEWNAAGASRQAALDGAPAVQRYKQRRGELDPAKRKALDVAAPGWSAGRTRGRKARPAPDSQGGPGLD
jgi:hypothetical protein